MAWGTVKLNDGTKRMPEIAWGSWTAGAGQTVVNQVEQAIEVGFHHLDTAQMYGNEEEVGKGFRESGLSRDDIWVTTKWSATDGKGITQSINESLNKLGLKYLDLYLIHGPLQANGDLVGAWEEMIQVQKEGLTKTIGVSNYELPDLEVLRDAGVKMPAVNQIFLHPYYYAEQKEVLEFHRTHGIVTEAYSTLYPLTSAPGGPLDKPLAAIAEEHRVSQAAVLFAWARSKGAVIVTSSRQKYRLQQYLAAGDLKLTEAEVEKLDLAGARIHSWKRQKKVKKYLGYGMALVGLVALRYVALVRR